MGLSQVTKDYWVREIKTQIMARIAKVLAENNAPELLEELQKQAETQYLDELGVTALVADLFNLTMRREELDDKLTKVKDSQDKVERQLAAAIRGVPLDTIKLGYYGGSWDNNLRELAKQEIYPTLLAAHPIGQRVVTLLASMKSIELSIMLATSPVSLKEFLVKFFEKFGIPYEEDMI